MPGTGAIWGSRVMHAVRAVVIFTVMMFVPVGARAANSGPARAETAATRSVMIPHVAAVAFYPFNGNAKDASGHPWFDCTPSGWFRRRTDEAITSKHIGSMAQAHTFAAQRRPVWVFTKVRMLRIRSGLRLAHSGYSEELFQNTYLSIRASPSSM